MKRYIFLIVGIVVSVLFVMESYLSNGNLYEELYFEQEFSDAMVNLGVYPTLALLTVAITWGVAAL